MRNFIINFLYYTLCGIIIGLIIGLYQLLINYINQISTYLFQSRELPIIFLTIFLVFFFGIINHYLIKLNPFLDGSGVPTLLNNLKRNNKVEYEVGILGTIYCSSYSIFSNLPLGTEGPCVVLGGKIIAFINKLFKKDNNENILKGASCGFASAFLSPLAGISYYFEENKNEIKNIKSIYTITYMSFISFLISFLINKHHLLSSEYFQNIDFNFILPYLLLIPINFILAFLFINLIKVIKLFFIKYQNNILIKYREIILIPIIILLSYCIESFLGNGSQIKEVSFLNQPILFLISLLIIRLLLTSIYGNGKFNGGLVIPTMTFGIISSQIISYIFIKKGLIDYSSYNLLCLLSMTMIFALVNQNPITGSILVLSTLIYANIGFENILIIFIISLFTNLIICKLFKYTKTKSLYETLIEISNNPIKKTI